MNILNLINQSTDWENVECKGRGWKSVFVLVRLRCINTGCRIHRLHAFKMGNIYIQKLKVTLGKFLAWTKRPVCHLCDSASPAPSWIVKLGILQLPNLEIRLEEAFQSKIPTSGFKWNVSFVLTDPLHCQVAIIWSPHSGISDTASGLAAPCDRVWVGLCGSSGDQVFDSARIVPQLCWNIVHLYCEAQSRCVFGSIWAENIPAGCPSMTAAGLQESADFWDSLKGSLPLSINMLIWLFLYRLYIGKNNWIDLIAALRLLSSKVLWASCPAPCGGRRLAWCWPLCSCLQSGSCPRLTSSSPPGASISSCSLHRGTSK